MCIKVISKEILVLDQKNKKSRICIWSLLSYENIWPKFDKLRGESSLIYKSIKFWEIPFFPNIPDA